MSADIDMNLRVREMMASRLEDTVSNINYRATTNPIVDIVRALCENSMWLIKDWPMDKDVPESFRSHRMDALGRLRQLLRARPPRHSDLDSLIIVLADALLTISEQWPGSISSLPPAPPTHRHPLVPSPYPPHPYPSMVPRPPFTHPMAPIPVPSSPSSIHIPPTFSGMHQPPPKKLAREGSSSWTVDGREASAGESPHPFATVSVASPMWSFFDKEEIEGEKKARCKICTKIVSRNNHGTSAMKAHITSAHPELIPLLGPPSSNNRPRRHEEEDAVLAEEALVLSPEGDEASSGIVIATVDDEPSESPPIVFAPVKKEEEMDEDYSECFHEDSMESHPGPSQMDGMSLLGGLVYGGMGEAPLQLPPHSPPIIKKKPGKPAKASSLWEVFTKERVEQRLSYGICSLCGIQIRMQNHGTNLLWGHLRKYHIDEYKRLDPFRLPKPPRKEKTENNP